MRKLILDFETASACDLRQCGARRYSEDVTTEVISLSYSYNGESIRTWTPKGDVNLTAWLNCHATDADVVFVAHNSGFEKAIWRNILVAQCGWPDVPNERWEDTQAVCAMKAIPLKLEKAILALRLVNHKDAEGSKLTNALSKPDKKGKYKRDPTILERVYEYNRQDVRATQELLNRIGTLSAEEYCVWLLDQKINERGIGLDMAFIAAMQSIVDQASLPLLKEFRELTGGLKPTQTAKLKVWLAGQGLETENLRKETIALLLGEETEDDDEWNDSDDDLGTSPDLTPLVRRVLEIRSLIGSASVKKLKRMQSCVGCDDRARGLLQYHGAGPGRWAGRLLQPHNFPRGSLKDSRGKKPGYNITVPAIMSGDADFVHSTIGEPIESVISCLRHAIVAAPNHLLLSGDYAGIEARVLLGLAGQHDKTELLAAGLSAYCDMGRVIYKREINKEIDTAEYQVGKNSVLGLGFQMGWRKFKKKYAPDESDEFCQQVVNAYRDEWAPKVPKLWQGLQDAALDTIYKQKSHSAYGVAYLLEDGWLTARLPSGRKLWYFNPQKIKRAMPWDELDIRNAWTYQQTKSGKFKTIDAYGGLLTENVVQGLARDLMVHAMFKLEENGFPIVLTVHDEIVAEPLSVNADEKAFRQIMEDRPQWAKDLQIPVAVETWKGERYRK